MKRIIAIIIISSWVLISPIAAGDAGTQSPFSLGVGARSLALGGANTADCEAATAAFWNPSMLAAAERLSLTGFHARLFDNDVFYQYFGLAVPTLDYGVFGVGVVRLGVDRIEKRDVDNLLLGHFEDNRLGVYVAYGRYMGAYAAGITINVEQHSLDSYKSTSTPALSLAISRHFGGLGNLFQGGRVSVIATNLIQPKHKLDRESVAEPMNFNFGVNLRFLSENVKSHSLNASANLSKVEHIDPLASYGLEYKFLDVLHLRGGVRDGQTSFGVGVAHRWINFDYALINRELGALHMFSLTVEPGRSVAERREARDIRRERLFQRSMAERLKRQNLEMLENLLGEGKDLLEKGELEQAALTLNRALFVGVSAGLDTTQIADLYREAQSRLERALIMKRFRFALDSAMAHFERGNLVEARSFAATALREVPESPEARTILEKAEAGILLSAERDRLIESNILYLDSLLGYGRMEQALEMAISLQQVEPDDERVKMIVRRAEFGLKQQSCQEAFAAGDYKASRQALDSAEELFPGHQWCAEMRAKLARASARGAVGATSAPKTEKTELNPAVMSEIKRRYEIGRQAFDKGELEKAIAEWEAVLNLIPDFQSTRQYLVTAYKFSGVGLYSRGELKSALAAWNRAVELDPDNNEIKDYIRRTEGELKKMEEFSYER
jgi:tetratricopeptide (TPR) repeat protein